VSVTSAQPLTGSMVWRGEDLARSTDWIRAITATEVDTMDIRPGDIQLLNNHVVYHARTTYEDDPRPGRDRFLMRLWLSMSNSRALPEGYEALWGSIEAGALRGGIAQAMGAKA
jgi:hypothetical protein